MDIQKQTPLRDLFYHSMVGDEEFGEGAIRRAKERRLLPDDTRVLRRKTSGTSSAKGIHRKEITMSGNPVSMVGDEEFGIPDLLNVNEAL